MLKIFYSISIISVIIFSCGSPNEPEDLTVSDGGYKIVSKFATSGYAQDVIAVDSFLYIA